MKEVDRTMTELIQTMKDRKNEIITIIDEYFKAEREKVVAEEQKWRDRQKICEELLKLSSKKDSDQEILLRSKYVTDGIAELNEKVKFNEMKIINSIDMILHHQDDAKRQIDISSAELKDLFKNYMQINEYKRIQYKC